MKEDELKAECSDMCLSKSGNFHLGDGTCIFIYAASVKCEGVVSLENERLNYK